MQSLRWVVWDRSGRLRAPGARTAPRPPKNRSATTGAMSAWLSSPPRLQPGEHPVHHAEQQHRQRLVAARAPRSSGRAAAIASANAATTLRSPSSTRCRSAGGEEPHVLGQHAVLGLRAGVDGEEGVDQAAHPRLGRERRRRRPRRRAPAAGAMCACGDLDQQLVLVAHVVVERRLGDAAGLGDLVHRRRGVAAPREQLRGAGEDRLALAS